MELTNLESNAAELLSRLGITANYAGFYHTAHALSLTTQNPQQLMYVTKSLYPDIAKQFSTNPKCIERNIRTVCGLVWKRNPQLLCEIARFPLAKKPTNSEFLAILTAHLTT